MIVNLSTAFGDKGHFVKWHIIENVESLSTSSKITSSKVKIQKDDQKSKTTSGIFSLGLV
jgi:hypothetical protein